MQAEEREKLFQMEEGRFLSIGISEDGEHYGRYPVPWESTANAYKMQLPKVYLAREDLADEALMDKIRRFRVWGCYIFCPLEDYSFLSHFTEMHDLNIYAAHKLKDISFLKHYTECRLLFIAQAHLENINDVAPAPSFMAKPSCLALYDCVVEDITWLHENKVSFHELVICNPQSRDERARWEGLRRLYYYDIKET